MLRHHRSLLVAPGLLILLVGGASGSSPALDARALSARIDELVAARLARAGVPPAPVADDAEFFRRLSLDLNGRIPALDRLTDFLDDTRPDTRRLWVDDLLGGRDNAPLYVKHFTNVWRRQLLAHTPPPPPAVVAPLEGWLRRQVRADTPYDRLVRGLLTDPQAAGFFQANENKPENLAGRTARLFLGLKLECAQCHDDRAGGPWTRKQFWEYAAFFAGPRGPGVRPGAAFALGQGGPDAGPARIRVGDSDTWVEARFPDGGRPDWERGGAPRAVLAGWLTRADNPWFARAAVNRVWHYFLGVGLIDPVDGLGVQDNPPSHPELLDELTRQFAAHAFDLKYLVRAIAGSQTYQRTSRQTHPGQKDPRLFARAAVRGLSPEQLFDSVLAATGYRPARAPGTAADPFGTDTPQAEFLAPFDDPHGQPAEFQASIQQALVMMNGKLMEEATSPDKSPTLAAVIGGEAKATRRHLEELYLVTLCRKPRPEEARRLLEYAAAGDRKRALRDIFWALLNSTEFVVNH
jgi:hypothetical protein